MWRQHRIIASSQDAKLMRELGKSLVCPHLHSKEVDSEFAYEAGTEVRFVFSSHILCLPLIFLLFFSVSLTCFLCLSDITSVSPHLVFCLLHFSVTLLYFVSLLYFICLPLLFYQSPSYILSVSLLYSIRLPLIFYLSPSCILSVSLLNFICLPLKFHLSPS